MAKSLYLGVSDLAHKIKKIYLGVDNVARQVKKGYIGVDGVAHLFYTSSVGSLPYRVDLKGSAPPYEAVAGPMDINTFVRYGSDVKFAEGPWNTTAAATKDFIFTREYGTSAAVCHDAATGATTGKISMTRVSGNMAGTSNFMGMVQSQYSNAREISLYDPPTLTWITMFSTIFDYANPIGGYHDTFFVKEDDNEDFREYNQSGTVVRVLHTDRGRYNYFDNDYVTRLSRLDGANGNLLMWKTDSVSAATGRRWSVLNYNTLAAVTRFTSYPLYKDYPYSSYIYMKP